MPYTIAELLNCSWAERIFRLQPKAADQGAFRYDAAVHYTMVFPRGKTPKEAAGA